MIDKPKIAIVAGGTGGHFFPAKALAMQLRERHYPLIFMTDKRIENKELESWMDVQQFTIESAGLNKKSIFQKIHNATALLTGIKQAMTILKNNPVAAIIGFGGYPSVPPLCAARLLPKKQRPAIILHEGNAIIGKANAVLARFATVVATSFPETIGIPPYLKTKVTGLPIRPDITTRFPMPYHPPQETINLLVWGGSLGARIFGEIVPYAVNGLSPALRKKIRITQQVRQEDIERIQEYYNKAGIQANLAPFLNNIADLLQQAHLVIGRSGGSSVAELALTSKPAILVPYPHAANQEQLYNARILQREGAAWIINQPEFTVETLTSLLQDLFNHPEKLQQAALSHQMAHPDAAKNLADLVEASIVAFHQSHSPNH